MNFFGLIRKLGRGFIPMSPDELLRPANPIVLAAFDSSATPLARWKVVTDASSLAGFSSGGFEQMRDEHGRETFARFSGALSKEVRAEGKRVRSGFAALQSHAFEPTHALGDLDHLRVRMRSSDDRAYVINLRVRSRKGALSTRIIFICGLHMLSIIWCTPRKPPAQPNPLPQTRRPRSVRSGRRVQPRRLVPGHAAVAGAWRVAHASAAAAGAVAHGAGPPARAAAETRRRREPAVHRHFARRRKGRAFSARCRFHLSTPKWHRVDLKSPCPCSSCLCFSFFCAGRYM